MNIRVCLRGCPSSWLRPPKLGISTEVAEVGKSFEENARLKATTLAAESGLLTLADDSGLEVEALGGEPGTLSARYAGEGASDRDRVNYLLAKLEGVPREKRQARFRCVIAIATPEGNVELCSGECDGIIAFEPKGNRASATTRSSTCPNWARRWRSCLWKKRIR